MHASTGHSNEAAPNDPHPGHEPATNGVSASPRRVAVLGATGSVGRSALDVIAASGGRLAPAMLSAHTKLDDLIGLATQYKPSLIVATNTQFAAEQDWSSLPKGIERESGHEALAAVVTSDSVDVVLAAIVGAAGLRSTWAALEAGKTVALANKETLVAAGPLVGPLMEKTGGRLLPVDSEHSAVFQALQAGKAREVERIVLTASGGPFLNWPIEQLVQVTVEDALSHPTWEMGPKITVDSATMMNKALEVIEARWLFNVPAERIGVVIHPQSVVHSFVEFIDGSVVSQLSPPDMRLPIQYALEYPDRHPGPAAKLDWQSRLRLDFEPPDTKRFPAIELGFQCARAGGSSGAVLNAANEAAVAAFLDGDLHFTEIVPACRSVLNSHQFEAQPTLDDLIRLDRWARKEIGTWVCA